MIGRGVTLGLVAMFEPDYRNPLPERMIVAVERTTVVFLEAVGSAEAVGSLVAAAVGVAVAVGAVDVSAVSGDVVTVLCGTSVAAIGATAVVVDVVDIVDVDVVAAVSVVAASVTELGGDSLLWEARLAVGEQDETLIHALVAQVEPACNEILLEEGEERARWHATSPISSIKNKGEG